MAIIARHIKVITVILIADFFIESFLGGVIGGVAYSVNKIKSVAATFSFSHIHCLVGTFVHIFEFVTRN